MIAVDWTSLVRLLRGVGIRAVRPGPRGPKRRKTSPGLESLESISLLSGAAARLGAAAHHLFDSRTHRLALPIAGVHRTHDRGPVIESSPHTDPTPQADPTPQTGPTQTATLSPTLTNFTNLPMSPSVNLFDPSLGTLTSVTVTQSATLQSNISVQNLNLTTPAVITASLTGSYQINGLSQPIVQAPQTISSQPMTAGPLGSSNDTVTFPPLVLNESSSMTLTDPASLAFYSASAGRAAVTPTVTAVANASSGSASNQLRTAHSSATATVTVTYTYIPSTPIPSSCPTVGAIGRIGVHHQRTLLVVPFNGPVNPTLAGNPNNYYVISRTGHRIRIVSASYNPATNSVTLRPARRLNVHHRFRLSVTLPCTNGMTDMVERVPFGTKFSLIGFHNHRGQFVTVRDGRIVRADPPRSEGRHGPHR